MSEHLFNRKHYEGNNGATLKVKGDDDTTTAELTQVEFEDTSDDQIEGFSVVFEGPQEQALDQGVHAVEHSEGGEGQAFLSPILGGASKKRRYQLVVSKLKDDDS